MFGMPGVHPRGSKNTQGCATQRIPSPKTVEIPLSMHIGKPCECLVRPGDVVKKGTCIGGGDAYPSVPVHSSVSGTVKQIADYTTASGAVVQSVVIESDGQDQWDEAIVPPAVDSREGFLKAVRDSGLVGLGGAGFPTWVKLDVKDKPVDYLLINFAECEPYITSDFRTAVEDTELVFEGIQAVMKYTGAKQCIIGVESNKPEAVKLLRKRADSLPDVSVKVLKAKYPQGAEKVLIHSLTGRTVHVGKLPLDVGCLVLNITSCAFLAAYLKTGRPLVERRLTVDGCVAKPGNYLVPIGTSIADVLEAAGGCTQQPEKVIMGGPMMGLAVPTCQTPVLKNNNAILAFSEKMSRQREESACIRCARCITHCPYSLAPAAIDRAVRAGNVQALLELNVSACMECGCCSYICPAKRHLVERNRLGKQMVRDYLKKEEEMKHA